MLGHSFRWFGWILSPFLTPKFCSVVGGCQRRKLPTHILILLNSKEHFTWFGAYYIAQVSLMLTSDITCTRTSFTISKYHLLHLLLDKMWQLITCVSAWPLCAVVHVFRRLWDQGLHWEQGKPESRTSSGLSIVHRVPPSSRHQFDGAGCNCCFHSLTEVGVKLLNHTFQHYHALPRVCYGGLFLFQPAGCMEGRELLSMFRVIVLPYQGKAISYAPVLGAHDWSV